MPVRQETMRKLKKDFEDSGCDMVIDVSHIEGVRNLMNISDLYRDHKYKLSVLNKGIERCKEEVKQREVEDLLDGDLYEKEKDRNIMWLKKMISIKNFLSVLIILLTNILNFKIHLLNNNLELLRTYRNEVSDVLFDYKEDVSDYDFKSQMEGVDKIFKAVEILVKFWDSRTNQNLVGRLG